MLQDSFIWLVESYRDTNTNAEKTKQGTEQNGTEQLDSRHLKLLKNCNYTDLDVRNLRMLGTLSQV